MDDVDTIERSQSSERGKQESSPNAERGRHEHREQNREVNSRSHRSSSRHKCQRTKVDESRERPSEHQATTRLRGVLHHREATTVVEHCGVSAGTFIEKSLMI